MLDNILFKISVNRYYSREVETVLLFLIVAIIVSLLANSLLLLAILGVLTTILLIINAVIPITKNQKKFDVMIFNQTNIEIGKESIIDIDYADIKKIVLHYFYTKGDQAKVRVMTGRENTIKIITKEGKKIVKNIWCENDADYCRLKLLGNFLKEKEVDVKMKGFSR